MPRLPLAALALFIALVAIACSDDDANPPPFPDIILTATDSGTPTTSAHPTAPDLEPGTWTRLAPLPTPRSEVAVAEVDGLIYVVGGFEASGAPSTKVEVYDPATNTWSAAPDLPRPRHHPAAIGWGDELLVIGGFEQGFDDPVATVLRLDAGTSTWIEDPALNVARGGLAVASLDGRLAVVGGLGVDRRSLGSVEYRAVDTNEWHLDQFEMSVARDHLGAGNVILSDGDDTPSDHLYAIGGRTDLDYSHNVDANESTPGRDAWESHAPLPTARSGIALAVVDFRRIYVFGGEAPSGTFDTVEVYDPETDTWDTAERMPTARHGMGAAVVDGVIYVIGGGPTPGLSVTGANEAYKP